MPALSSPVDNIQITRTFLNHLQSQCDLRNSVIGKKRSRYFKIPTKKHLNFHLKWPSCCTILTNTEIRGQILVKLPRLYFISSLRLFFSVTIRQDGRTNWHLKLLQISFRLRKKRMSELWISLQFSSRVKWSFWYFYFVLIIYGLTTIKITRCLGNMQKKTTITFI